MRGTDRQTGAHERYEVAVVRVEIRRANGVQLLIELLEVGREPDGDRLIGRVTAAAEAGRLLEGWLSGLGTV